MTLDNCIKRYEIWASDDRISPDIREEHKQMVEWLKELKSHREAWAKLREDIKDEAEFAYANFDEYKYEVLGIDDVDDLPNDDYRYGMKRALELIDIYKPNEGDGK